MRKLRRTLHLLGPVVGMALVIGAVLFADSMGIRLFLVVAGLMLTEAGIWRMADPLLPDERRFMALRAETDHFIALVRQLNSAALALEQGDTAGSSFALDEVRREMHRSVDRMVEFAGKVESEASATRAGNGSGPESGAASGSGA